MLLLMFYVICNVLLLLMFYVTCNVLCYFYFSLLLLMFFVLFNVLCYVFFFNVQCCFLCSLLLVMFYVTFKLFKCFHNQSNKIFRIDGKSLEIGSFRTKSTPVLALHFTRRKTQSSLGRWIIRPQLIDALRAYICDVHIYSTEDSQRVLYCINEQFQALLQIMFIFFY